MITVKEALEEILSRGESKYRVAKNLGIAPITVDKYLTQEIKTMREDAVATIAFLYGIKIDPLFVNGRQPKENK